MDSIAFRKYMVTDRSDTTLLFCGTGDTAVQTCQGLHLVYMHAGTNPFEVVNQAVKWVPFLFLYRLFKLDSYWIAYDDMDHPKKMVILEIYG